MVVEVATLKRESGGGYGGCKTCPDTLERYIKKIWISKIVYENCIHIIMYISILFELRKRTLTARSKFTLRSCGL